MTRLLAAVRPLQDARVQAEAVSIPSCCKARMLNGYLCRRRELRAALLHPQGGLQGKALAKAWAGLPLHLGR